MGNGPSTSLSAGLISGLFSRLWTHSDQPIDDEAIDDDTAAVERQPISEAQSVPASGTNGAVYDPPLFSTEMQEQVARALTEAAERKDPRIAVIGERGVGKSSLINSLRGIKPNEPGAAKVGADEVVTDEQLNGGAFYRDAGLIYQDVPGCRGNQLDMNMDAQYIERFELDKADCCLFVYVAVVNVDTLRCACQLKDKGVSVYFVRNKVDVDCANDVEDGNVASEDEAVIAIRKRAYEQMQAKKAAHFATDEHVFLISAKYSHAVQQSPRKFDFERLRHALMNSIKDEAKRLQVKQIFGRNSKALAACRAAECRVLAADYVVASAASGAIPVPGVSQVGDLVILTKSCEEFQRIFCLSEAQLPPGALAGFGTYLALKVSTSIPFIFGVAQALNWAADGCGWFPVFGIPASVVLGASVSAVGMWLTLRAVITRLEEVSAAVYEVAMNLTHENAEQGKQQLHGLIDRLFPQVEKSETLTSSLPEMSSASSTDPAVA